MESFKQPTQEQIDAVIPRLISPEHASYFFNRLENPLWIEPLKEKGIFNNPPPSIDKEEGFVSYPPWPASRYLARMASLDPELVAQILSSLDTDNANVIGDILDASKEMPSQFAAKLAPTLSRCALRGKIGFHFKDAYDFCVQLLEGGEATSAMELAVALFTPKFEEGLEEPKGLDPYWYKKGLSVVVPIIVKYKPHEFLSRLCEWLQLSVEAKKHVNQDTGEDYSWLWRPAIEEHPENHDYEFTGLMVGFLRIGFEQAIEGGKLQVSDASKILDQYKFLVFNRLRIHLINKFADQSPELARQFMMDKQLFDSTYYKHEYAMLVRDRLSLLTPKEKAVWFSWIDSGPDLTHFNEHFAEEYGREATKEEQEKRRDYWQFEKLHCVRQHLEGPHKNFYEKMLAEHGEPELADINIVTSGGWGGKSPVTLEELSALTFEEALNKITSWRPDKHEFMGPDYDGAASIFGQYIATKPEEFSAQAGLLMSKPAIYVRTFIHQITDSLKAGKEIDLEAMLSLCQWVIHRPIDECTVPSDADERVIDKDWRQTRDSISRFVLSICIANVDGVPKYSIDSSREPVWQLISALYKDDKESNIVHDFLKGDPRTQDYYHLGINSSRGRAVEAGLEYARWTANQIKASSENGPIIPGGFSSMPEVQEMLEWQISPENRSVTAMAIIGSRTNLIYWIDKKWLSEKTGEIFHLEETRKSKIKPENWAAWNAFLVWVRPHIEFYKLLKKQYEQAVTIAEAVNINEDESSEPMMHLGQHLMILFGRGDIGIDDEADLIRRFIATSNPVIRQHAISYAGRALEGDQPIPNEIITRYQYLWEMYWGTVGKNDAKGKSTAWLFGAWFASGKFPEKWALKQLNEFVGVVPAPEPDHIIMEQLERTASADIQTTANILDQLVHGDREGWRIHGWIESIWQILKLAIDAGGSSRHQAIKIIDYLGRRGYTSFGDLLPPS